MFCSKCGAQIPDESQFCPKCGNTARRGDTIPSSPTPNSARLSCPNCGSRNLQMTQESDSTTKGGYSGGKGCLGYLMFGPLGLLCGSCGGSRKTTTTHKTFWVCQDCGTKFRNPQEAMQEHKKNGISGFAGGLLIGLMALIVLVISFTARADAGNSVGNVVLVFGLFFLAMGGILLAFGWANWKEYEKYRAQDENSPKNGGY